MGVAAKIGEVAKERGITLKELSRQVDVPYTTLYNAVKRDSKMDFETVLEIAGVLGILWYDLYPQNDTLAGTAYEERLASACEWLALEQSWQEVSSGNNWSAKEENEWLTAHYDEAVSRYNVQKADLLKFMPRYAEPTEEELSRIGLHSVGLYVGSKQLSDCINKIAWELSKLNEDGQKVAIERVKELAQLPQYQKHAAGDSTQIAGTGDENDPE